MNDARRLKQQGLLLGLRKQRDDLEVSARIHLGSIEDSTFVVDSPLALNGQAVFSAASQLRDTLAEAAKVQGRIDELEDALGL